MIATETEKEKKVETLECNQGIKLDSRIKNVHGASARVTQPVNCGGPGGWKQIGGEMRSRTKQTSLQCGFQMTEMEI